MNENNLETGPVRATLLIALRALLRSGFIWLTASQTHLLDLRPWALFIVFFILGLGNFTFLSTKPWRSEKLIEYHLQYRRYQAYMIRHPSERPKGDAIRWVAMISAALAAALTWGWLMVLISHFIFQLMGTEAFTRVGLVWLVVALLDWASRVSRMVTQGQIGVFGVPFEEAFRRVSNVPQNYDDSTQQP